MRTTVNLDEEAYSLAMLRAKGQGITLGAALSAFIREASDARLKAISQNAIPEGLMRGPKGMLMFAPRKGDKVLTTESVKKALLQLEEEDDERRAFPGRRQHTRRAV
jgi:hypothetical protein